MDALATVRDIVPATIGSVPGTTVDVGGNVAATDDANDEPLDARTASCSASCS